MTARLIVFPGAHPAPGKTPDPAREAAMRAHPSWRDRQTGDDTHLNAALTLIGSLERRVADLETELARYRAREDTSHV